MSNKSIKKGDELDEIKEISLQKQQLQKAQVLENYTPKSQEIQVQLQSSQLGDLQKQIRIKEIEVGQLINSIKSKLKSKSKFADIKHNKEERNEKLEVIFKKLSAITREEFVKELENIKQGLSEKLTEQEVNNLYCVQAELTKLRKELENIEHFQSSLAIDFTNFNLQDNQTEPEQLQTHQEIPPRN